MHPTVVKYAYALLSEARKPPGAAGLAWPADGGARVRHSVLRLLLTALQMGAPGVADALADLAAVCPAPPSCTHPPLWDTPAD